MRGRGKERGKEALNVEKQGKRKTEKRKIMGILEREIVEDFAIIGGLIGVQFVYAGNSVLLSYFLSLGINPLTIIIFSAFATFLVLSPPSVYFEWNKWPKKFTLRLLIKLLLISFGGVTLFQSLFLKGMELTSPAMATAMPNLAPGLIFVIAAAFRMENIKLSCIYSKVKITGTLLCVMGAVTMSVMQSTTHTRAAAAAVENTSTQYLLDIATPPPAIATSIFDAQKVIGCLYLMAAVLVLSTNIVLQASTLIDMPAPISLCAITSIIGVIITSILELIQYHKFDFGWPVIGFRDLIGYSLLGGTISGVCVSFNGWAMKKRGPVLVSMFTPIGTVVSAILSFITMGEIITIGSVAGMFLMFSGLYFFLWARGKEDFSLGEGGEVDAPDMTNDVEKPLLF